MGDVGRANPTIRILKSTNQSGPAFVFLMDGLRSSALGLYGNTTIPTPFFDEFASRSIVFDQFRTVSTKLEEFYDAALTGRHPMSNQSLVSLSEQVRQAGGRSCFFTDAPERIQHPAVLAFDRVELSEQRDPLELASSAAESYFAEFLEQLLSLVLSEPDASLIWVHCRGMRGAWDAPLEYRTMFQGPDDPQPLGFLNPPASPDEMLAMVKSSADAEESGEGSVDNLETFDFQLILEMAYAAQTMLIDRLMGIFFEQAGSQLSDALVCLMAPRGYSLNEHDVTGLRIICSLKRYTCPCSLKFPDVGNRSVHSHSSIHPTCTSC